MKSHRPNEEEANGLSLTVWLPIVSVCATATIALAIVAIWPAFDVGIAKTALTLGDQLGGALPVGRVIARAIPVAILVILSIRGLARTIKERSWTGGGARSGVYVALTFALGPGLLVNGLLKPYSHRPRPAQTMDVAASGAAFRPFYAFDGACARNCSFSSGEAAAAIWTAAPALLAPPVVRTAAVILALAFGLMVGAMRMLTGAHYLSDVAFSILAVLLLIAGARRLLRPGNGSRAGGLRKSGP